MSGTTVKGRAPCKSPDFHIDSYGGGVQDRCQTPRAGLKVGARHLIGADPLTIALLRGAKLGKAMNKKVKMSAALLSVLVMSNWTDAHADTGSLDVNAIVTAVMKDQYGDQYDAKHSCWSFAHTSEQGHSLSYCMRPGRPEVVDTAAGKQLYLYAANVYDINDDNRYVYSHVDPGLMGAFKIQLDAKGGWTYLVLDNAMEFGTTGYCGCNDARFVKLSNHGDYGWLFVSGGTWQGTTVADYSILVAHKGNFVDISNIPQITEKEQDIQYDVEVAPDQRNTGMFPLNVTKTKGNTKVGTFQVNFDPKAFNYSLPSAH